MKLLWSLTRIKVHLFELELPSYNRIPTLTEIEAYLPLKGLHRAATRTFVPLEVFMKEK